MQVISLVRRSIWVRALIALVVVLCVTWAFILPDETKLWVLWYVVPLIAMALAPAALAGWLTLKWRPAIWTFWLVLFAIVALSMYGRAHL